MERYRQSDVNFWGLIAIGAVGLAVGLGSISAFLPDNLFIGLHTSRLDGGNLNSLRAEVVQLENETARLRLENDRLLTRFTLTEQDTSAMNRRVGALESSLPVLLEQLPPDAQIDSGAITSSTSGGLTQTRQVEGGSVVTSTQSLESEPEPMPDALDFEVDVPDLGTTPDDTATLAPDLDGVSEEGYGLAMGSRVNLQDAYVTWQEIRNKAGALLIGLEPVLSRSNEQGMFHIVAGPVAEISRAEELCTYVQRIGVQCLPVPYSGYKMPL